MNFEQLIADLQKAVADQFGADQQVELFPSKYFNQNVVTIAPNSVTTVRAPKYCATTFGASAMASAINGADLGVKVTEIVLAEAMVFTGLLSGWSDSELVPWLHLDSDKFVNAGVMLDFCNHGYPASKVVESVGFELTNA